MTTTRWGRALDPSAILPEYPRPQLVRDSCLILNGRWEYAIRPAGEGRPGSWDGTILVPFSPEAPLSGVGRTVGPDDELWYRRELTLPPGFRGDRVLLNFGAVDQRCEVFVDGVSVGAHRGGYLPFTLDITEAMPSDRAELVVRVRDTTDTASESRGKQSSRPGGIWYTPQSGIWQTVWAESVPQVHVTELLVQPCLAEGALDVTVLGGAGRAAVRVLADGREVGRAEAPTGEPVRIPLTLVRPWSPEDPFLYDLEVVLGDDRVTGYAGLREVVRRPDAQGVPRVWLNGDPLLNAGLLDQGYWPDGLYTAPSDEALVFDIELARSMGFTMLRKHIKVEPARWYYHCDRLGMLVWQDMVNGGGRYRPWVITAPAVSPLRLRDNRYRRFAREDAEGREQFLRELHETVRALRAFPSIVAWVPFNEGWGQFDAAATARLTRELDPTRLVDHASGWHDQGAGDLQSLHIYFRPFRTPRRRDDRALALSEFGGYSLPVDGHRSTDREFGYRRYRTAAELEAAIERLWRRELAPAVAERLVAFVYTQLSDVEDEVNGLVTDDREVVKVSIEAMRRLNGELVEAARAAAKGMSA
jgi:hypothetical protein